MDLVGRTIELSPGKVGNGGRSLACVIPRDDEIVAESPNLAAQNHDTIAHAEQVAIRQVCQRLGAENLEVHEIYVRAHPCQMCIGVVCYCCPDRRLFVTTREEYSRCYKDDRKYFELENFYEEFSKPSQERRLDEEGTEDYRLWRELNS